MSPLVTTAPWSVGIDQGKPVEVWRYKFQVELYMPANVVLGIQWLRSLGEVVRDLEMQFKGDGEKPWILEEMLCKEGNSLWMFPFWFRGLTTLFLVLATMSLLPTLPRISTLYGGGFQWIIAAEPTEVNSSMMIHLTLNYRLVVAIEIGLSPNKPMATILSWR